MVFSSAAFLFAFLPLSVIIYNLLPGLALKNIFLCIISLCFYAFGEPVYVLLMLASVGFNYICGIVASRNGAVGLAGLIVGASADIICLGYFKYTDFLIGNINVLFNTSIPLRGIVLPIGISFFTFQEISYLADSYRNKTCQKNPLKVLLYISFFPQLIAGPIVKYSHIEKALSERKADINDISEGICRFIFGLSKKLLLSNTLGLITDNVFGFESVNIFSAWIGAVSYCMQLYFDFSGYSDMAIGLGRIFGFRFNENFNYPYISGSIKEFWRRWHISLSSWFRDYVYVPLGGNRKGIARKCFNTSVVFILTGIWHGASWTFVVWGIWHGALVILENIGVINIKNKLLSHIYTLVCVCIGFVIFRAETLALGINMVKNMFFGFNFSTLSYVSLFSLLSPYNVFIFILGIIFSFPAAKKFERLKYPFSAILFILCILSLAASGYNPFIYFRF